MTSERRIALIGVGVIGNGWAAHLLARQVTVHVHDPHPETLPRLRDYIDVARPAVERLGGDLEGWEDRLVMCPDVETAVAEADFVQENGPEREDVKSTLIEEIDRATPPDVVVASSSSGLLPSRLASMAPRHPERILVGHPFNPVYLIPLVEVVGAPGTAPEAVRTALDLYEELGKKAIHVRQELPGHLVNRLQAALWREAYSLVSRGVATVSDIDAGIAYGPGLRWALLGPVANQHLSGGPGGLRHVLDHLGPPTERWMDDLGSTPHLDPVLKDALVDGVETELDGLATTDLVTERDRLLVELLLAKAASRLLP